MEKGYQRNRRYKRNRRSGRKKKTSKFFYILPTIAVVAVLALGITAYRLQAGDSAYERKNAVLSVLEDAIRSGREKAAESTEEEITENTSLLTVEINGNSYVGQLDIPDIELSLPIMETWSNVNQKTAPGIYQGTPYKEDFIIAGSKSEEQFQKIKTLGKNNRIYFTDMRGNTFTYKVTEVETVSSYTVDIIKNTNDWELTLFIYSNTQQNRYAVRAVLD